MAEEAEQRHESRLILEIAEALRTELGALMEEQPGFRAPDDAGQLNRAFRIVARCILQIMMRPGRNIVDRFISMVAVAAPGLAARPRCHASQAPRVTRSV